MTASHSATTLHSAKTHSVPVDIHASPATVSRRRLRILIVDEELPFPPNSGKRIRSLNLAIYAAKRHHITYLSHRNASSSELSDALTALHNNGIHHILVPAPGRHTTGLRFYCRLLLNLFSSLPYSVQLHTSRRLQTAVHNAAQSGEFDIIQCEATPCAHNMKTVRQIPWLLMAHNIESLIWERMYRHESNPIKRWYIRHQWRKYHTFERRTFSTAQRLITVSNADATLARTYFSAPRVSIVDNGVDVALFRPTNNSRCHHRILFLGSLDWRPNQDAVRILLRDIMPHVLRVHPQAELQVVGRRPPAWMVRWASSMPRVSLCADVPDVRPYLWAATVMVVPLRIGGGSRLKILEAAAAECPVISTRVGAEGLLLTPDQHYLCADEPNDIARLLVRCLHEPCALRNMVQAARRIVEFNYDWSVLAHKLEAVWHETVSEMPERMSPVVPPHG